MATKTTPGPPTYLGLGSVELNSGVVHVGMPSGPETPPQAGRGLVLS